MGLLFPDCVDVELLAASNDKVNTELTGSNRP
jgi:hypothetical protein